VRLLLSDNPVPRRALNSTKFKIKFIPGRSVITTAPQERFSVSVLKFENKSIYTLFVRGASQIRGKMLEVLGSIPVRTISVISDIRGANSKRQGETGRAISILQTEDTGRLQYRRWKSLLARGYSGRVLQTIQYR
jgi:hypothetical protein